MERDYAEQRAEVLRKLDGLRVVVDAERKIGYRVATSRTSPISQRIRCPILLITSVRRSAVPSR